MRPCPTLRNQKGAILLMVLVMVVILGLGAGMAGTTWKTVMQRVKEEELLFRGDQYRKAIESYAKAAHGSQGQQPQERAGDPLRRIGAGPGGVRYPNSLEDLLRDPRSPGMVKHLRQMYKDPFTGDDFELIKDPAGRIKGVRSASLEEPFKKGNFPPAYENFQSATTYREWEFVFEPGQNNSMNTTGGARIQGLPDGSLQQPSGN